MIQELYDYHLLASTQPSTSSSRTSIEDSIVQERSFGGLDSDKTSIAAV